MLLNFNLQYNDQCFDAGLILFYVLLGIMIILFTGRTYGINRYNKFDLGTVCLLLGEKIKKGHDNCFQISEGLSHCREFGLILT